MITDETQVKKAVLWIIQKVFDTASDIITREGKAQLMRFLVHSDFIMAPASSKFHCHFAGGLIVHSYQVWQNTLALVQKYQPHLPAEALPSPEGIFISTIFHDLCKVSFYEEGTKWAKNEQDRWYRQPVWKINDKIPLGHGERSLYMLQNFIRVSVVEALAIRYHLQFIDPGAHNSWTSGLSSAWDNFPYTIIAGLADSETAISETQTAFLHQGEWYEAPESMQFPWMELKALRTELQTQWGSNR